MIIKIRLNNIFSIIYADALFLLYKVVIASSTLFYQTHYVTAFLSREKYGNGRGNMRLD